MADVKVKPHSGCQTGSGGGEGGGGGGEVCRGGEGEGGEGSAVFLGDRERVRLRQRPLFHCVLGWEWNRTWSSWTGIAPPAIYYTIQCYIEWN